MTAPQEVPLVVYTPRGARNVIGKAFVSMEGRVAVITADFYAPVLTQEVDCVNIVLKGFDPND